MRLPAFLRMDSYWSLIAMYVVFLGVIVELYWFRFQFASSLWGLSGLVWPTWFYIGGGRLCLELRAKGYEWANVLNCIGLHIRFPRASRRVPPADELRVLPGYVDTAVGMGMFLHEQAVRMR